MHFHYRVTFTGYILCFDATTSHDLVTLTFDLLTLRVFRVQCFLCPTHIPILSYDYRLLSYEYWISDHISVIWNSHCACAVSRDLKPGAKICPHFWNPSPQIAYSLCNFHSATTKIKPCYRQKIAFSHYEGYRVDCACAVSRDLCIGGPPKPHVTIFYPELPIYYRPKTYAATMAIKGSLYLSIPMLKRFSVAKKPSPVKIGPRNGGFRKFKGSNIKYSHRDPQKALPYPERRHLTYFA